jgi:hypothetical protein
MATSPAVWIPTGSGVAETGRIYVAGPDGHVLALDLDSGTILARGDFNATPVAARGDLVICWRSDTDRAHTISLLAARRDGDELTALWQTVLDLPEWVEPVSSEADAFRLEAEIRDDVVAVTWEAHARYRGGAPPPAHVEAAAAHDRRETVCVDCTTGAPVPGNGAPIAAARAVETVPAAFSDRQTVGYRRGVAWSAEPWRAGDGDAVLARAASGPGVSLLRLEVGRLEDHLLSNDRSAEAVVTSDGALIFLHEPGRAAAEWRVFSAVTGEPVATLPFEPGTEWITALDGRALYQVAEDRGGTRRCSLNCRRLQGGELQWSHVLSEVTLKPPPPPMP